MYIADPTLTAFALHVQRRARFELPLRDRPLAPMASTGRTPRRDAPTRSPR